MRIIGWMQNLCFCVALDLSTSVRKKPILMYYILLVGQKLTIKEIKLTTQHIFYVDDDMYST